MNASENKWVEAVEPKKLQSRDHAIFIFILVEVIAKLPAPEKSKILRLVDRVAIGDP